MAATNNLATAEATLRNAAQGYATAWCDSLLGMGVHSGTRSALSTPRGRIQAKNPSAAHIAGTRSPTKARSKARQQTKGIERWIADKSAKRVPTFVQGMTGLSSSVAIRQKYGEGATFQVGQPAPAPKAG